MVQKAPYLFGKFLDPFCALIVGSLSYAVYEKQNGREEGHSLSQLLMKRYGQPK
ncbi:hypothetical protein TPHA_0I02550 [Tetrapisispora phaffii CBS 4417]|uniref:Non-classical export protein 1 n=1 Tax=Tetrapisispora phaffii (strain ATCC 24235 / CBS 4417 / NBRC 1672 / NRRL Y-8282 / UCD 70-5) TaxID=1071381 RepID=G8BXX8_TETPH|nr:hypothetical protein TPHA_0I02550 [Tetrapisispora phaffii CBS 4417]CCE64756.1 hypothetical protein TPHA_0I02550 [Tetrapisispora phaffii CBS 4417]